MRSSRLAASDCAGFITSLGQDRNIRIKCDLSPAHVLGNADRLSQALTNLLNNALQYGKDGGEVRVITRVEHGTAMLSVADDGPGVPADVLPHMFKRFYRADKARRRAEGHAGLGLAICKSIVEAPGGTITVASEPGVGTTVTIRLPTSPVLPEVTPHTPALASSTNLKAN